MMHYCAVLCLVVAKACINLKERGEMSMEKNRIRPVAGDKRYAYELCKTERSSGDAQPD